MKDDKIYIHHILESVESIVSYPNGMEQPDFFNDKLVQDAVIRNLQVIGEATKKISNALKSNHSSIPWRQRAGMRDKLTPDYMGVDLWAVWLVVKNELPILKRGLEKLLNQLSS